MGNTRLFIEMADIIRFSANMDEKTLIASAKLSVHVCAKKSHTDTG